MASCKQIEANRRNAQLSTGPTSEEGKATVARNATTHGFYCRHLILPGEREEDLLALRKSIRDRLRPMDELESLYVERVVLAAWKLNRVLAAEPDYLRGRDNADRQMSAAFGSTSRASNANDYINIFTSAAIDHQKMINSLERSMDKAIAELIKLRHNLDEGLAPEPWAKFDAPSSAIVENKPNSPEEAVQKAPEPEERSAAMTIDVVQPTPIDKNTKTNPIVYNPPDPKEVESQKTNPFALSVEQSDPPTAQQESPGAMPGAS